jgi:molybdenum cofactor cytidylyltransferase
MRFGPVPLADAAGAILAHSVPLPSGRMRKGKLLDAADIDVLAGLGLTEVTVARLDAGDQHEDAAALDVAKALVRGGVGLELKPVGTGRVNIHAVEAGVAGIVAAQINATNAVDPMITVATVPEWQRQFAGGMVATVKIISYGVAGADVRRAVMAGDGALRLHPPVLRRAALIQTSVDADDDGAKGYRETAKRLQRLSVQLAPQQVVAHRVADLAAALTDAAGRADLLLILTGSATSDAADVGPSAVRAAGGAMEYFGMPVDPGNLLFIGHLNGRPVIGLPGCAKSPALNGADWVLERLICSVPLTGRDIAGMGVGGLLKEIPIRPQPRERNNKGAG